MEIIADLHIHSRYSMATSKLGTPEYLDLWARKKGISLVGTGDFTHPAWRNIINLRKKWKGICSQVPFIVLKYRQGCI